MVDVKFEKISSIVSLENRDDIELHSRAIRVKMGPAVAVWHHPERVLVNGRQPTVTPINDVTRLAQIGIWLTACLVIGGSWASRRRRK